MIPMIMIDGLKANQVANQLSPVSHKSNFDRSISSTKLSQLTSHITLQQSKRTRYTIMTFNHNQQLKTTSTTERTVANASASVGPAQRKRKRNSNEHNQAFKQRAVANSRERVRTQKLNQAYKQLQSVIPKEPSDKMSKIHTLKLALAYMYFLLDILNDNESSNSHNNHIQETKEPGNTKSSSYISQIDNNNCLNNHDDETNSTFYNNYLQNHLKAQTSNDLRDAFREYRFNKRRGSW